MKGLLKVVAAATVEVKEEEVKADQMTPVMDAADLVTGPVNALKKDKDVEGEAHMEEAEEILTEVEIHMEEVAEAEVEVVAKWLLQGAITANKQVILQENAQNHQVVEQARDGEEVVAAATTIEEIVYPI
jgi:hypothetical protein